MRFVSKDGKVYCKKGGLEFAEYEIGELKLLEQAGYRIGKWIKDYCVEELLPILELEGREVYLN